MTLTIVVLWVLGVALLVGVAIRRGRIQSEKSVDHVSVDVAAASANAQALAATMAGVASENGVTVHRYKSPLVGPGVLRVRDADGLVKSVAASALTQAKPGNLSAPKMGKKPITR